MKANDLKPGSTQFGQDPQQTNDSSTRPATSTPPNPTYSGQPDDLHDLFGSKENFQATDEDDPLAALRNDPNYSALIRDLEYIASQARLLFAPAEEAPSDEVWNKIQSKLTEDPSAK